MNIYRPKLTAAIWLLTMLLLIGLGGRLMSKNWLETSFLALLPSTEQQPDVALAIQKHNEQRDRKLIWLTGGSTPEAAIGQARLLQKELEQSKLFKDIVLEVPQQQFIKQYQKLFPYRYQLLDEETRRLLNTDPKALLTKNLAALYGPMGQMTAPNLERDPLLLLIRYLKSQTPVNLNVEQSIVVLHDSHRHWALVMSDLQDKNLQLDKLESLLELVKTIQADIHASDGELLVTGMPLFTAYGADSAKQEISTVGLGSSIGIIALMLLTFRSPIPLLLSFLAIGSGMLAAWVISVMVFGKIHIITLVFGASLVGVADDYALHFVCDSFSSKDWQPRFGLKHVFFGLLVGLLTNVLSYAGLVLSPFPGLQEVALFSAVGLLFAWLTVVLLFPLLLTGFNPGHQPMMFKFANYWQQHWPSWLTYHRRWLVPLLSLFIIGGLWQLNPRDDVRLLQSASPELMSAAEKIKQLLPVSPENQFFLVSGRDVNEWRQNEQQLLIRLGRLTQQKKLKTFQGLSDFWMDQRTQQENYQVLDKTLYQSGLLKNYMVDLGFSMQAVDEEIKRFKEAHRQTLSLGDWLTSVDASKQALWLGCNASGCSSRVTLTGINDLAEFSDLQKLPGVAWVDQVGQISALFERYRIRISALIAVAYALVFAGLGFRLSWRKALAIISVPVLAALVSLAMSGWFHQLFSLFNLFALLLVLGIGVDDAVFFAMTENPGIAKNTHYENKRGSTSLAVTLSALTTLLAFGLLAVSSTEVVHAFGFTVGIGIFTAFLCSPLVGFQRKTENS